MTGLKSNNNIDSLNLSAPIIAVFDFCRFYIVLNDLLCILYMHTIGSKIHYDFLILPSTARIVQIQVQFENQL